jgi:PIN domain nuclease of toxin-antitoxin system
LALLLDTHILVWFATGDERLRPAIRDAIFDGDNALFTSIVNAWEYADLEQRGRFGGAGPLGPLLDVMNATVLDLPAACWALAAKLPNIHRDPVDRMMIAHAQLLDLTLVSEDRNVRKYEVGTLA